ncbi:MAG: inositol monophosphatase family protein [Eubacteriales bacterium]|jgi:myo-inositol-1(or 4)-monophosphatase|nr:inositol monophosphatase family protein [Eubacteriales bacterium]
MELIYKISKVLIEAGKIILAADNINDNITQKHGTANFVTTYDLTVQNFLYHRISDLVPGAHFIGEESTENRMELINDGINFIIDPIDGTTNFVHGYRHSAISIALLRDGIITAGLVYNPYLDEMFYAKRGEGAFLNKKSIHVSDRQLHDGLVSFGTTPYKREYTEASFQIIKKLFTSSRDIRRSGSAALDLCYVACARCDLFFEVELSPWDYAAGSIILEESGGVISSFKQTRLPFDASSSVIAANPNAYRDFYDII